MKILKIFGIVAGIHVFALILIFANPGCSSSTRPPPVPSDTAAHMEPAPQISAPALPPSSPSVLSPAPLFNPDAPAVAAGADGRRFSPTRPNTPAADTLVSEPVANVTPATTHIVVSGDNLWELSKKHGVTVAQLAAVNNLRANAILRPGQKLIIPAKTPSAPAANPAAAAPRANEDAAAKAPANSLKHTVRSGETLSEIARQYGVRTNEIVVLNNIVDPAMVKAGAELIIPGWETRNGKSGKSGQKGAESPKASSAKAPVEPRTPPPAEPAPAPAAPQPPPASDLIPLIRVDDNPLSPAPRTP